MKKLLIAVALVGSLSSCSKDEDFAPLPVYHSSQPQPTLPSKMLTLDMLDIHLVDVPSTKTISFIEGGYRYEWNMANEEYTLLFQVDVDTADVVQHITGRYNGHSFVMWNGGINICGGQQGVQFNYTLK